MADIRGEVKAAVESINLSSVYTVLPRGGAEVSLIKDRYVIRIGNWVVNTTSGEWKATTQHWRQLRDGCYLETIVRGQGPEEILRSVATALAMGVFDG